MEKIISGSIKNWALQDGKIAGNTDQHLFWMDANGENYSEYKVDRKPLSNIEWINNTHFIYITTKGIETFDIKTQTATIIFKKPVPENDYNYVQVKFLGK